ncbi:MAG: hypothetical protein ABI574_12150 [Burkholderiales bacterium]
MKLIFRPLCAPFAVAALLLGVSGCAGVVQNLMPAGDFAKLDGFHDPAMEKDSRVVDFKSMRTVSGDVWQMDGELNSRGLGKIYIRTPQYTALPDKKGYAGYAPGRYAVSVKSATAKNIKWEIWSSNSQYQMHSAFGSTDIHFQKIMGPFSAGEVVNVDYLKSDKPDSYGYSYKARTPVIVVYSVADPGARFTLDVHKPVLSNP